MAELGEEIHISIDTLHKYYGLPIVNGLNTFLINSSRNSVSSIQTSDQKLIQTWTLSHPENFTSPVAFWAAESSICCIVDHKKLLMWQMESESLKSAKKVKYTEPVFAVISLKEEPPIVVFSSGAVGSVQNNLAYAAPSAMSDDEELIWADATVINKEIVVVQLTYSKETKDYMLCKFVLRDGTVDDNSVGCISVKQASSSLKGYCFSKNAKLLKFLTIWNNGDVYAYSLDGAPPELLFRVPEVNNNLNVGLDVVGASHLAIVKCQHSGNKNEERTIEIWDLKYRLCKVKKTLKQILSKNVQIKALAPSIFLSSSEGVIMVPVALEASTLSAVVGKSNKTDDSNKGNTYSWHSKAQNECKVELSEDPSPSTISAKMSFEDINESSSIEDIKVYCHMLTQSTEISEKDLVRILKLVVNRKDIKGHGSNKDQNVCTSVRDVLLNSIFKVSFSDIFLRQELKELTFSETLVVLENLVKTLDCNLFCTKDNERPTDLQIVNWMQLVIQVHFEELLLSPDKKVRQLLKKFLSSLKTKIDVYSELEQIWYLLLLTQKKKNILPDKSTQSKYCIETLYL